MKKQKIMSSALVLTMLGTMCTTGVWAEENSAVIKTGNGVLDDVVITFNSNVSDELLTKENFAVTSEGEVPEYVIEKDGNNVTLKFESELDYATAYTVTIKNAAEETVSFKTENNPMTILFEEDFSSADAINRFTNTGNQSKSYSVDTYGQSLLLGSSGGWTVGGGAFATIKGSETWRDYELTLEYKTRRFSSPIVAYRQVGVDTEKVENQVRYGYFVSGGSYAAPEDNPAHLYIGWQSVGTGAGNGIYSEPYTNAASERMYGMKITAIGNSHKAENYDIATGVTLNSIEREIADYNSGAVGFGVYYDFTYFDNIKVVDKGFMFDTTNKKNDGTVILTFTEDIKADTVDGNIVVRDGENIVESTATVIDTNKVMVKLANPVDEAKYTVTVKKEVARLSDSYTMANDKAFNILIDLSKAVEDYAVTLGKGTVADGELTVSYNVENNRISGGIDLVFASYDNSGKLLGVKVENIDVSCAESKAGEITIPAGAENVCMVWNGFEYLKPLGEALNIEF